MSQDIGYINSYFISVSAPTTMMIRGWICVMCVMVKIKIYFWWWEPPSGGVAVIMIYLLFYVNTSVGGGIYLPGGEERVRLQKLETI